MNLRLPWRKSNKSNELSLVEQQLEGLYKPVEARPEFLDGLRQQLVGVRERKWLGLRVPSFEFVLLVIGALASLSLVLVTGIRAVLTLLGTLGVIQASKQVNKKPIANKMAIN